MYDGAFVEDGLPAEFRLRGAPEADESAPRRHLTARELLQSGLVGMWRDRDDIGDSIEFARKLREAAQRRQAGPDGRRGHERLRDTVIRYDDPCEPAVDPDE
jgi:hypothetical protein